MSGQHHICLMLLALTGVYSNPLLAGEPYKEILDDPNWRPKPEVFTNKTIDQLITDAYGGLPIYMSDNFLDMRGDITVELDMILKPEQFKSLYEVYEVEGETRLKRKATRPVVYRWKDKTIPYEFVTSHFNVDEIYYIKAAMTKWQTETCLTFRPFRHRTDRNRIRFQNGNGCNSLLGMTGGVQPINLQAPGCRYSGLYLHEVGHAIGLVHEHQLPDRDEYIYIMYDNVAPSMRIWFNKYSEKQVNQYGVPFEYSSVMHYGITAFSKDGYSQTIKAKDSSREAEIGRVYLKGLSFSDIKVVNLMYDCNAHCSKDPNCREPAYLNKDCKCVRPGDGVITPTTPTPTGECVNIWGDGKCNSWAGSGECDANPVWMRQYCTKACKACEGDDNDDDDDDVKPDKKCRNIYGDRKCEQWSEEGECDANPIWMKDNCKKACRVCKSTGTGSTDNTNSNCRNDHQACDSWAGAGYCLTNWYTKEHCHKACDTCSDTYDEEQDQDQDQEHTEDKSGAYRSTAVSTLISLSVLTRII